MESPGSMLKKWLGPDDEMWGNMTKPWGNMLPTPSTPSTPSTSSLRRHAKRTLRRGKASSSSTRKTARPSPWSSVPSTGSRILSKFKTPSIRERRDLLEHFPIDFLRIKDADETYAIVWNEKLLKQWKNERPASYNEHVEYEFYTEYRLVHTLRQHKDMFEILAPKRSDEIIRIRYHAPRPPSPPPIRLVKRKDIWENFPVLVDKREGRSGEATFAVIIRSDYMRSHSREDVARMTADLMRSLHASKFWKVLPPGPGAKDGDLCWIEMTHA
jgi:hypothetical protein